MEIQQCIEKGPSKKLQAVMVLCTLGLVIATFVIVVRRLRRRRFNHRPVQPSDQAEQEEDQDIRRRRAGLPSPDQDPVNPPNQQQQEDQDDAMDCTPLVIGVVHEDPFENDPDAVRIAVMAFHSDPIPRRVDFRI